MLRILKKKIFQRQFSCTKHLFDQTNVQKTEQVTTQAVPRGRLFFVTLKKSKNHQTERIKKVCATLKLKKIHQLQVYRDTPTIRGLIYKVRHLVEVNSVSTAAIFPKGTENFGVAFKTEKQGKEKARERRRQQKLKRLKRFSTFISKKLALNYPRLRKTPSRTHLK